MNSNPESGHGVGVQEAAAARAARRLLLINLSLNGWNYKVTFKVIINNREIVRIGGGGRYVFSRFCGGDARKYMCS